MQDVRVCLVHSTQSSQPAWMLMQENPKFRMLSFNSFKEQNGSIHEMMVWTKFSQTQPQLIKKDLSALLPVRHYSLVKCITRSFFLRCTAGKIRESGSLVEGLHDEKVGAGNQTQTLSPFG